MEVKRRRIRRLDLGWTVIHVEYITEAQMRIEIDADPDELTPLGAWDSEDTTIYVLKGLSQKQERQTILHELGHAALDLYDGVAE